MYRIIFLLVLLFLCYSCNKKEYVKEFTLESFSETIQLKGTVVKTDKELFFSRDIVVDNNSAIILDDESGGKIIHVFDLSTHQLKQSLLQKGKGPGEVLGGWQLSLNEKTGTVCLLDVVKESMFLLKNKKQLNVYDTIIQKWKIPENVMCPLQGVCVNDSCFFVTGLLDTNRIALRFGKVKRTFYEIEEERVRGLSKTAAAFYYESRIGVSNNGEKIVLAGRQINDVVGFNKKGKILFRRKGPLDENPKYKHYKDYVFWDDETTIYYDLIRCTDNFIYLLYNGNKKGSNKEFGGNTILVFDWKGKPQYSFELDRHIITFDFDKETNTLYAISHISAEEYLIRYKLPNDLVL